MKIEICRCEHFMENGLPYIGQKEDSNGTMFAIFCMLCGKNGPYEWTKEDAITSWNDKEKPKDLEMRKKIGLLGGSFDPPTFGHLSIAEYLIESKICDEIQFMPAFVSYHGKEYSTTCEQRIEMVNILISTSKFSSLMKCNTFEIDRKLSSVGTFGLLSEFLKEYSQENESFYFVIGLDNAEKIESFIHWKELIEMVPLIVCDRGTKSNGMPEILQNSHHQFIQFYSKHKNCSSSKIRENLSNYFEIEKYSPIEVLDYYLECIKTKNSLKGNFK